MDRRNFLATQSASAVTIGALGLLSSRVLAQEVPECPKEASFTSEIARNHGHELVLSISAVLRALQQSQVTPVATFDIQGTSGHPHSIGLSGAQIVELLSKGSLALDSSVGAGHTHQVAIQLVLA